VQDRPDLEMVELRDAAETAERAVIHWQERLRRKVAAAHDLGGFVSWILDSVAGSRRARIDAAVAEVEAVKQRLDQAIRTRDEALARLADAEQIRLDQVAEADALRARREALADRVRVAAHPLAERFNAIEAELDTLQLEHDVVRQAYVTGTSLAAALKSTRRAIDNAAAASPRSDDRPRVAAIDETRMRRLESQARAFEDACATMGLSIRVHVDTPIRDPLGDLVRKWGHSLVRGMMTAVESERFARSLQGALEATEGTLAPLLQQLEGLQARLDRLKQEREGILQRFERA